jgi:hypothetical protein
MEDTVSPSDTPDAFSLQRTARIRASIDLDPPAEGAILAANDLDEARWSEIVERWDQTIEEDARQGRADRLRDFDVAYVARVEEERGPVELDELTRILVASERRNERAVLAELGVPAAAVIRLERLWLARTAADRDLSRSFRASLREARAASGSPEAQSTPR